MKLYATITSERATKGQGGKELYIAVRNSNKELIAEIAFESIVDSVGDGILVDYWFEEGLMKVADVIQRTKGKNQKGETLKLSQDTLDDNRWK